MKNNQNKILSIQALRGIAALLVVMFHYRTEINKTFPDVGDFLFFNGSMGVDLFFLISGFIAFYVANNLNAGVIDSRDFIIKRLTRVIPLYYLMTVSVAGSSLDSWYQTARSMLFIPLGGASAGPVYGYAKLFVGWTLNYEMFFYVICAFAILFGKRKWMALTVIMCFLVFAPSYLFGWNNFDSYAGYDFNNIYLKMTTNPIMIEFLSGVAIGWLYDRNFKCNSRFLWDLTLASSILFFIYIYFTGALWGNGPRAFMIPGAFLLFSVIEYEKRYGIKWPNWLIHTGTISFSIYLIHSQSISVVSKLCRKLSNYGINVPGAIIVIISLYLTIVLAKLSYKYIEVAASNWLRALLLPRKSKALSAPKEIA